jgi:predicted transcriptional regulator
MSKRVTVNLPDDVAERLGHEPNASAYVTEALRERIDREQTRTLLAEHGMPVSDEGIVRARERRRAAARLSPERREELRRLGRSVA